ncbi:MAG: MFS transporter [Chloroflexi bacterium]|nr:MFS transporter [Chloroflexota bacterium]
MTTQETAGASVSAVLRVRPFLLLWLSQLATQVGANMVLYGLTVIVLKATSLSSFVSLLLLAFLVPAVLLSAVAGVYVDRFDRRWVLVVTNVVRAAVLVAIFLVSSNIPLTLLLILVLSTATVFFTPAEAAMIPFVVPRSQLVAANGLFTLTLNGAFALGYAFLGPLITTLSGPEVVIIVVAILYAIAAVFCFTLPSDPPPPREDDSPLAAVAETGRAVGGVFDQLREGATYIRSNKYVSWSLFYLGIAGSLIGVIGVLGPSFAERTLGLDPEDLVVVVLPLGFGIVTGSLLLNSYGRLMPRRRAIEGGLIALGILLFILTIAGPISQFLQGLNEATGVVDFSSITSLVAVVIVIAFLAGMAYAIVAISSQTQLQEDIPEEVRGRVFGVLNLVLSVGTFVPIIIVGPTSDLISTTPVILVVAVFVLVSGIASVVMRGRLQPGDRLVTAETKADSRAFEAIGPLHPDEAARGRPEGAGRDGPSAT